MPEGPAVFVHDLTVRFAEREALREVSLTVRPGEFVALTGPNGSGKTTLLRAILGFLDRPSGSVELWGRPTHGLPARERALRVAWVPQQELPRDNLRVLDYVLFGRYAHLPPFTGESEYDRAVARRALEQVGLADRADSGVLELSGGERQRVLLARALAQESPLLLLDEPTAHLDIGHELDLFARVRRLVTEKGGAALAAMHDLNLAARFADRIVVLSRGRLVEDGPPEEVLSERLLREVWGVSAELRRDPSTGHPYLVPSLPGEARSRRAPGERGPVHVVGGGGAAARVLRHLADRGFRLSAGALHLLDSDAQAAEELGVVFAAEVPFAPLGERARSENRRLLGEARAVVVAPFAVGPSNLANLEDLGSVRSGVPIFLLGGPPGPDRDFTGGRAGSIYGELERSGAVAVTDLKQLDVELDRRPEVGIPPAAGR
ncbi:MAG: ABC transporter ATP-binding protein [Thermoplasmata archaeon]